MLVFVSCLSRVILCKVRQHLVGGGQGVRSVLLKEILGDIGHIEVTVDGPGPSEAREKHESDRYFFH